MIKFIKIQLFGDPSGDPQQNAPDAAAKGAITGAGGAETAPNDADWLIQFKKEHVSREEYEREKNRADSYLKAIMEDREDTLEEVARKEKAVDYKKLAAETFVEDNRMTDIEYITNVLEIRDAAIKAGKADPFLPQNPEPRDVEIAEAVADVFRECLELAAGDNASFNGILQGRMKDSKMPLNNYMRR